MRIILYWLMIKENPMQIYRYLILFSSFLIFFTPTLTHASYTEYCKGTTVTNEEDAVIQRLVTRYGVAIGCEIGGNCLKKHGIQKTSEKFSISWKKTCGLPKLKKPIMQTTFNCSISKNHNVCCWPQEASKTKLFKLCSDSITKKKKV